MRGVKCGCKWCLALRKPNTEGGKMKNKPKETKEVPVIGKKHENIKTGKIATVKDIITGLNKILTVVILDNGERVFMETFRTDWRLAI